MSDSMAIDMGSASTIIAVRGRGVVIDEPSVVAINKVSGEVMAVGNEAQKMQGREARDVVVVAPLIDGVVADFETNTRHAGPLCAGSAQRHLAFQPARNHERALGSNSG